MKARYTFIGNGSDEMVGSMDATSDISSRLGPVELNSRYAIAKMKGIDDKHFRLRLHHEIRSSELQASKRILVF